MGSLAWYKKFIFMFPSVSDKLSSPFLHQTRFIGAETVPGNTQRANSTADSPVRDSFVMLAAANEASILTKPANWVHLVVLMYHGISHLWSL